MTLSGLSNVLRQSLRLAGPENVFLHFFLDENSSKQTKVVPAKVQESVPVVGLLGLSHLIFLELCANRAWVLVKQTAVVMGKEQGFFYPWAAAQTNDNVTRAKRDPMPTRIHVCSNTMEWKWLCVFLFWPFRDQITSPTVAKRRVFPFVLPWREQKNREGWEWEWTWSDLLTKPAVFLWRLLSWKEFQVPFARERHCVLLLLRLPEKPANTWLTRSCLLFLSTYLAPNKGIFMSARWQETFNCNLLWISSASLLFHSTEEFVGFQSGGFFWSACVPDLL